ncbi:PIN domain-containing protein [Pedobacter terrae]|uniref:PIN domain-containing protein n=1 Tax=Pedobacter terrae TaxID=405671 RepID=UPI002FF54FBE
MRNLYPGHYSPKNEDFKSMWENGIFIFDTNVLLDLYRYSDGTVSQLMALIEQLGERIWIPYQVTKEYHKNLNIVISEQVRKYESTIKALTDFKYQIDEKRSHPFLSEELTNEIAEFCEKFDRELVEKQGEVKKLILQNPTKEKIADLIGGKVGTSFTNEELEAIYKEGEARYKNKVPPGFSDLQKPIPDRYGDLVFWKEILKKNASQDNPIILVTSDRKIDWYLKELGLTIGPRPELIEEFKASKPNLFYMYPTDQFLKYSKEYLEFEITEETIQEVGEFVQGNSEKIITELSQSDSTVEKESTEFNTFDSCEDDLSLTADKLESTDAIEENESI